MEFSTEFLRRHAFLLAFALAGIFGGLAGVLLGALCGFFADAVLSRAKEEFFLRNFDRKKRHSVDVYLCALLSRCMGGAEEAASVMARNFGGEWLGICQNACASDDVNFDILCENLAASLKKSKIRNDYQKIFSVLKEAESLWNDDNGRRPSEYLKELLGFGGEDAEAYRTLDLEPGAPLSEVKKAHRRLAAKFHPDRENSSSEDFIAVQKAYETLCRCNEI